MHKLEHSQLQFFNFKKIAFLAPIILNFTRIKLYFKVVCFVGRSGWLALSNFNQVSCISSGFEPTAEGS